MKSMNKRVSRRLEPTVLTRLWPKSQRKMETRMLKRRKKKKTVRISTVFIPKIAMNITNPTLTFPCKSTGGQVMCLHSTLIICQITSLQAMKRLKKERKAKHSKKILQRKRKSLTLTNRDSLCRRMNTANRSSTLTSSTKSIILRKTKLRKDVKMNPQMLRSNYRASLRRRRMIILIR